jgi:hypothetical protein
MYEESEQELPFPQAVCVSHQQNKHDKFSGGVIA